MEERQRGVGFFFVEAAQGIDRLFAAIRHRFKHLFKDNGRGGQISEVYSALAKLQQGLEDRKVEELALERWLPPQKNIDSVTTFEYFFYISKMMDEYNKKKDKQVHGRGR